MFCPWCVALLMLFWESVCVCDEVEGVLFSRRPEIVLRQGGNVRSVDSLVILADSRVQSVFGTRHFLSLFLSSLFPSPPLPLASSPIALD